MLLKWAERENASVSRWQRGLLEYHWLQPYVHIRYRLTTWSLEIKISLWDGHLKYLRRTSRSQLRLALAASNSEIGLYSKSEYRPSFLLPLCGHLKNLKKPLHPQTYDTSQIFDPSIQKTLFKFPTAFDLINFHQRPNWWHIRTINCLLWCAQYKNPLLEGFWIWTWTIFTSCTRPSNLDVHAVRWDI